MSLLASKLEGLSQVFPHDHPACNGRNVGSAIPASNLSNPNPLPWEESRGAQGKDAHGTLTPLNLCPHPFLLSPSTYTL